MQNNAVQEAIEQQHIFDTKIVSALEKLMMTVASQADVIADLTKRMTVLEEKIRANG